MTRSEKLLRKELRVTKGLFDEAQKRMQELHIPSFNEYIRHLMYNDHDRRKKGESES